jgi:hypothetical protein
MNINSIFSSNKQSLHGLPANLTIEKYILIAHAVMHFTYIIEIEYYLFLQ